MPSDRRAVLHRLLWLATAAYAGTLGGIAAFANWRLQLRMVNPMTVVGAICGAVITPGANIVLGVVAVASCMYVVGRVPSWVVVLLAIGFAGTAYWAARTWSVS